MLKNKWGNVPQKAPESKAIIGNEKIKDKKHTRPGKSGINIYAAAH